VSAPHDVHPHDLALLYDLVDGRLAPRAADELARRLGEEPKLRTAYEGLLALRRRLAALPTPSLPADFLERVRARAGFPAALPTPAPAPSVPASSPPAPTRAADALPAAESAAGSRSADPRACASTSDAAASSRSGPAARLLAFARFAYAAAAVVVAALGVFVYVSGRGDSASAKGPDGTLTADGVGAAARARPEDLATAPASTGEGVRVADRSGATPDAATARVPRPFGPNGAVAPGLLPPSERAEPSGAPDATNVARRTGAAAAPVGGGGGSAGARPPAPPAAKPGAASPPPELAPAAVALPDAAFDGADRVLVLYAASYDAARAEVALLLDDARASRALDTSRVGVAPDALEKVDASPREALDAASTPARSKRASPEGAEAGAAAPLGTFLVELDAAALIRLAGALGPHAVVDASASQRAADVARATGADASKAQPAAAPVVESQPARDGPTRPSWGPLPGPSPASPAPPGAPSATRPPPSTPDAKPGTESTGVAEAEADADGATGASAERTDDEARGRRERAPSVALRRVRIVILPRR